MEAMSTRGHATFDALEQLIASLQPLPGRKAVEFFSEGFALSANLQPKQNSQYATTLASPDHDSWLEDNRRDHFFSVFERANRAHVAFYTFDGKGLRTEDPNYRGCFGCAPVHRIADAGRGDRRRLRGEHQ